MKNLRKSPNLMNAKLVDFPVLGPQTHPEGQHILGLGVVEHI